MIFCHILLNSRWQQDRIVLEHLPAHFPDIGIGITGCSADDAFNFKSAGFLLKVGGIAGVETR